MTFNEVTEVYSPLTVSGQSSADLQHHSPFPMPDFLFSLIPKETDTSKKYPVDTNQVLWTLSR